MGKNRWLREARRIKFKAKCRIPDKESPLSQKDCRQQAALRYSKTEEELTLGAILTWVRHNLTNYDLVFNQWRDQINKQNGTIPYYIIDEAAKIIEQEGRRFCLEVYKKLPLE